MSRKDDLWNNAEIISLEDVGKSVRCMMCNGTCTVDYEGQVNPSDECTGDCGEMLEQTLEGELRF